MLLDSTSTLARLAAVALVLVHSVSAAPTRRDTARGAKVTPVLTITPPKYLPLERINTHLGIAGPSARDFEDEAANDVARRTVVDLSGHNLEERSDLSERASERYATRLQLAISLNCVDSTGNETYISSVRPSRLPFLSHIR